MKIKGKIENPIINIVLICKYNNYYGSKKSAQINNYFKQEVVIIIIIIMGLDLVIGKHDQNQLKLSFGIILEICVPMTQITHPKDPNKIEIYVKTTYVSFFVPYIPPMCLEPTKAKVKLFPKYWKRECKT